jgi:hypothetical protein
MFIGFSFFDAKNTRQGLQNQAFSLFMLLSVFGQLAQQIMRNFVTQRSLYEVRERPSKTYSWRAFVLSNIIVEMPWKCPPGSIHVSDLVLPHWISAECGTDRRRCRERRPDVPLYANIPRLHLNILHPSWLWRGWTTPPMAPTLPTCYFHSR